MFCDCGGCGGCGGCLASCVGNSCWFACLLFPASKQASNVFLYGVFRQPPTSTPPQPPRFPFVCGRVLAGLSL